MSSTRVMSLMYPDKVFVNVPPLPRPWTMPISPLSSQISSVSSSLQWKEAKEDDKTLTRVLSNLQHTLRLVHKRKITWPAEESILFGYEPLLGLLVLLKTCY